MATKKKAVKQAEIQPKTTSELTVEAEAQAMVAGMQTLDVARWLAREAAGELAAGASDLTHAEDAAVRRQARIRSERRCGCGWRSGCSPGR